MDTKPDPVDRILAQWRRERPDLDVAPMGLIGRLSRLARRVQAEQERTFARFGLNGATFDVLATLRRSGPPYALTPSHLIETMMITSGTATNRVDQLEKAGLVARIPNPQDRRSTLVALTDAGRALVDEAVAAHVETQARLVAPLTPDERTALERALAAALARLEAPDGTQG
jgi:DNA-binding MarR family transcriptional regulator